MTPGIALPQFYFLHRTFPSSWNLFQLPSCSKDTFGFFIKIKEIHGVQLYLIFMLSIHNKLNSLSSCHNSVFGTKKSECWQCIYHFCLAEPLKFNFIIWQWNCFHSKTVKKIPLNIYIFLNAACHMYVRKHENTTFHGNL